MIRTFRDPILHQVCEPIDRASATAWLGARAVAMRMNDALDSHANGVGLAAPQIGHPVRIIILAPEKQPRTVMLNPEIIAHGPITATKPEGCLSFPGVTARVKRWTQITVRYWTLGGEMIEQMYHGWHARIIQHEIDHLNGICQVGDAWAMQKPRRQLAGATL